MTPEENEILKHLQEQINKLRQKQGLPTIQELVESNKRGLRIMDEWCAQSKEQIDAFPKEVKDLKTTSKYALYSAWAGETPILISSQALDMVIEAAFNFGKVQLKE